jgi:hypothetical protein
VHSGTPDLGPPRSEAALVTQMLGAYRSRDYATFEHLLSAEEGLEFQFDGGVDGSPVRWDLLEELRIHRRMFDPRATVGHSSPVPTDLYLTAVTLEYVLASAFNERSDLYSTMGGPVDPERWRVTDAEYHVILFFEMAGETDFMVDTRQSFVVLEDRALEAGSPNKFFLYQWTDLGDADKPLGVEQASWSAIKRIYR